MCVFLIVPDSNCLFCACFPSCGQEDKCTVESLLFRKKALRIREGLTDTYPLLLYEAHCLARTGQVSARQDHMGTVKSKRPGRLKAWDRRREKQRQTEGQ